MAYVKPPFFVRKIFNPLAMRFGAGGAATLSIPGRRSGAPRSVPVTPVEHGGARYLVSTRGESEWVRNLRKAGGRAVLKAGGKAEQIGTTEVPAAERPAIIEAYKQRYGKMVEAYFNTLPDPADHPVFKVEPA
jgi:deazaflavin-dependent oxidoreductase (nitroreductase family)